MQARELWTLIKRTAAEWNEDRVSRLAASLSFYTVFSLAPILIIVIAIAGAVFGRSAAREEVVEQLTSLMGPAAAEGVAKLLDQAAGPGSGGGWATAIGILLLVYGATNVFAELQDSLNTIWEVKARPGGMWLQLLRDRLLSFAMVLAIAFLLMVSLLVSAGLAAATRYISGGAEAWRLVNLGASMVVFTFLFAIIFKWVPDVKIRWMDVWIGATVTAALFTLGKWLIGLYLGRSTMASVYGAAGSLAILLIWVYYSAQILFIGAEFTQVFARRHGERIQPAQYAVPLGERERIQKGIPHQREVDQAEREKHGDERG